MLQQTLFGPTCCCSVHGCALSCSTCCDKHYCASPAAAVCVTVHSAALHVAVNNPNLTCCCSVCDCALSCSASCCGEHHCASPAAAASWTVHSAAAHHLQEPSSDPPPATSSHGNQGVLTLPHCSLVCLTCMGGSLWCCCVAFSYSHPGARDYAVQNTLQLSLALTTCTQRRHLMSACIADFPRAGVASSAAAKPTWSFASPKRCRICE